jgi:NAD(P)-dependent dehydrogenase (short-subunit alcohol dehydrogenase family)
MLEDGVIERTRPPQMSKPRIIVVSSDSHRSAPEVDLAALGAPVNYGVTDGTRWYAHSKLLLTSWAMELSRRLQGQVAVHSLCPGAVNTNIAREAPAAVKLVLYPVMRMAFRSPAEAAVPVVYLCAACALEGETGRYLHVHATKDPDPRALDAELGRQLWDASMALLEAR